MLYRKFKDIQLSLLGFGTMRLPTLDDGSIDETLVEKMTDYAIAHGVNYFDTAVPYHKGESERVIGKALSKYDRSKWHLADKYPGHQIWTKYDPEAMFESQLKKCGVEYFDFYLLHNVYEHSIDRYLDRDMGITEYFIKQRELGRIKHLGFSSHAEMPTLTRFLDAYGSEMEFCQIQLNYVDRTLQKAAQKYEMLSAKNIPVIVMEPLLGGKLANLPTDDSARLHALRPDESDAATAFEYLKELDNVAVVLSGMSNFEQMKQNIDTFSYSRPLDDDTLALLYDIADRMTDMIPCTACRYCTGDCPKKLDIPRLLAVYNELKFTPVTNIAMRVEELPDDKKPSACIGCGKCTKLCPQHIDIPTQMKAFADALAKIPTWAEVCKERESWATPK